MGSFNLSCAISGTTVQPYEACEVILVEKSSNQFAVNPWIPVSLPLRGTFEYCYSVDLYKHPQVQWRLFTLISMLYIRGKDALSDKGGLFHHYVKSHHPKLIELIDRAFEAGASITWIHDDPKVFNSVEAELVHCWAHITQLCVDKELINPITGNLVQMSIVSRSAREALIRHASRFLVVGASAFKSSLMDSLGEAAIQSLKIRDTELTRESKDNKEVLDAASQINVAQALGTSRIFRPLISEISRHLNLKETVAIIFEDSIKDKPKAMFESLFDDLSLFGDLVFFEVADRAHFYLSPAQYAGQDYENNLGKLRLNILQSIVD